jgi:ACS family hexuronate transporter-like MFS transporter
LTNPYESPENPASTESSGIALEPGAHSSAWKWTICGLLFLATMMMYMDRQTLATMAKRICDELHLSNEQYGQLEMGFGLAFAVGAIINGLIADRVSIRWFYPFVLIGWSVMGMATAYGVEIGEVLLSLVDYVRAGFKPGFPELIPPEHPQQRPAFVGLMVCLVLLGFFESGHWPCALITTQRILAANDRTFGNSLLQSGASVGAVLTPLAVWIMLSDQIGAWRGPFVIIGVVGVVWVIPWLLLVRGSDLVRRSTPADDAAKSPATGAADPESLLWLRRSLVLLAVVVPINFTWQFFRAWLAKMLQEEHGYTEQQVFGFSSLYYLTADAGCIAAGLGVKVLTSGGWHRNSARTLWFTVCTVLCLLGVLAAFLPAGPALLAVLLAVGFGALGMFPIYYSLTQEMSKKHQGLVSGILGFLTWVIFALAQPPLGRLVDSTKSYNTAIFWIVQLPIVACIALAFFWGRSGHDDREDKAASHG